MRTILALLLTITLFVTAARADVFIYRGVDHLTTDALTAAQIVSTSLNAYLLVDFDGGRTGVILYGKIAGAKRFSLVGPVSSNVNSVVFPKGKTESIIVTGDSSNTSPSNFSYSLTLYRGANTSLLIGKSPTHTIALRPSTLKGTVINTSSSADYIELHGGFTFQGAATIKANDASQSLDDAFAALVAGLEAKGYTGL